MGFNIKGEIMRTLVTGGAGFLGSHLCDALILDGHEVWCLDNFVTSDISNIGDGVHLIIDSADGDAELPDVDWIFHLASPAAPVDINRFKGTCNSANIDGTHRMVNHARECGSELLYASTMKVYGQCGRVEEYITSKCYGEMLCQKDKIARLANVYGPRMRLTDSRVVPVFITRALREEPLSLWNGGQQFDSFCYYSEIIEGLIAFMKSDSMGVIEFGYNLPISIYELAKKIIQITNSRSELILDEQVQVVEVCHQLANLERAKTELGWLPNIGLTNGLIKTITYFEEKLNVGKKD
jgi:nucleoside-diphosphate-sugar epimerase